MKLTGRHIVNYDHIQPGLRSACSSFAHKRSNILLKQVLPSSSPIWRPSQRPASRCSALQSIQESMFGGLKKAFGQGQTKANESYTNFADGAPSWEDLQTYVAEERKRLDVPNPDLDAGPTNPLSLNRTFGKKGGPRLKLYRDHAAWCPYCQKVWLQLEEKQIPYTLEKINMRCYGPKPPSYTAIVSAETDITDLFQDEAYKVPSGLLPAMELDGELVIESADIMAMLEEKFPDYTPLLPSDGSPDRRRADQLMRLERQLFGDWLRWLTSSWNHEAAKARFIETMDAVNTELGRESGSYFLGWGFSLVDCVFAPFLERIAASIPYYKGFVVRGDGRWKHLEAWFDAMETRPAYLGTRSDHYTHVHDLPPQLGGCASVPGSEELAAAIDGTDGRSWHLPLPELTSSSRPEAYSPGEDIDRDKLRAAARLVDNHEAIIKFAARGCGKAGNRPVTAPLSDPSAQPGDPHIPAVDAGLRLVAYALLKGTEHVSVQTGDSEAQEGWATAVSAKYLRDRVGVPRDLPLPAARQLRAHINWFIDLLDK